jgi:hypothetical protein
MTIAISCSWCRAMNAVGEQYCSECGHRADRSRLACDCPACLREASDLMRDVCGWLEKWAQDWREGWQEAEGDNPFD